MEITVNSDNISSVFHRQSSHTTDLAGTLTLYAWVVAFGTARRLAGGLFHDLRRGFVRSSEGAHGKSPLNGLGNEVSQKLVICKLYYGDVLGKKAKQHFVSLAYRGGGFIGLQ